jgi:hypothetical protein
MSRVVRQREMTASPAELFARILDVASWSSWRGYGPVPGIREAHFIERTASWVGSRIAVTNADGTTHVEEVIAWQPPHSAKLRMSEFSPPLSRLATQMIEHWRVEPSANGGSRVTRTFELHAAGIAGRFVLPIIALFLGCAAARHLRELDAAS